MIKLRCITCWALLLLTTPAFGQVSFGTAEKINHNWQFILADEPNAQLPNTDVTTWQLVDLPHDWSVKGTLSPTLASCTGFLPGGIGWYRKTMFVPHHKQGEKVYLYFEGVYNRSEVFVNGHALGKRPNGYISFMYDATPYLHYGANNTIAVRVDHSRSADSRWYTGSGIYRNVWMVYANPIHIAQWGVYAYAQNVTDKQATLHVEVAVENGTQANADMMVTTELFNKAGRLMAKGTQQALIATEKTATVSFDLKVKNPQRWSLADPHLYELKTTIYQKGKRVDSTTTTTGFRSFTFDPNKGFALNGEWMKLKGVCIHHDAGVLGAAVPRAVWERRLRTLKQIGCNAIRTSHNPQAPDLYALCDELGLLVMDEAFDEWEFPKRKWLEGWNVGTPGFEGTFDFFEAWGEKDLADMVRRDRNHPSVFAWSIGNEVDYPNDPYSHPVLNGSSESGFTQPIFGGYKQEAPDAMRLGAIAKRLAAVVRELDKSRPVTAGLAGVAMSNETEYPGALDIAGYNYTESKYEEDHQTYPNRVIFGSENRHDLEAWKAVADKEHIFGQFLWTGIDYLGESGRWPSRGFYSGLLSFGGFIKPRGYFRQSLWSDKPMAYLGTYPTPGKQEKSPSMDAWPIWNYATGQLIRVVCYTNAAKAQLVLEGKTVGQTKEYDPTTGIIYWDIPYKAGKLEVEAMNKADQVIARQAIQSSEQPYALTILSTETTIGQDGLAQIRVQAVDQAGVPVMLSDNEVTCQISGPGRLLGLEASNNQDMGNYADQVHRLFHGQILAYIQVEGHDRAVKVRFSSPWLKGVETTLQRK